MCWFSLTILVFSPTWEEHLVNLGVVLERLKDNKLFVKRSKCSFGQTQISHEGVATDLEKIECMVNWPLPKTIKQLRGFFGINRVLQEVY